MKLLIKLEEALSKDKKSREKSIPCECQFCKKTFYHCKRDIQIALKRGKNYGSYCSKKCRDQGQTKTQRKLKCHKCSKNITRSELEYSNSLNKIFFCSRSCSIKNTNKMYPKRKLTKTCKTCENKIYSSRSYCEECLGAGKNYTKGFLAERTLEDVYDKSGIHNGNSMIRDHARRAMKKQPQICKDCKYSKHVQVCHIKSVSSFDVKTKIKDVNNPNNLVLLCPNCHWELDNFPK